MDHCQSILPLPFFEAEVTSSCNTYNFRRLDQMTHLKQDKQYFPWSAAIDWILFFQLLISLLTVQLHRNQLDDWLIAQLNKD